MKKQLTLSITSLLILSFYFISAVISQNINDNTVRVISEVSAESVENYDVKIGERPPIDLDLVPEDAYYSGNIRIQFHSSMEKNFANIDFNACNKEGFVKTGILGLDELNKSYKVTSYESLFEDFYKISPASKKHIERHKAWGLHLWFDITLYEKADIKQVVKDFEKLGEIEIAEPVYKIRLIEPVESFPITNEKSSSKWTPNDQYYANNQWHFNNTGLSIQGQTGIEGWDVNAEAAWDIEKGNPLVVVAIIDSGVDFNHEDLKDNMWPFIGPQGTDTQPGSHGTHVAGTISAVTNNEIGVAGLAGGSGEGDGVRIMSIGLLSDDRPISDYASFVYAADNGAAISQNSWGYQDPNVYNQSALNGIDYFNANGGGEALKDGGITVFAAGNDNSGENWYPGYYSGAIAVASYDNRGFRSGFSNYGSWVEISAPGSSIASTDLNNSYTYKGGTSMACPHFSGAAALVISKYYGQLTNVQIREIMVNSAREDFYDNNADFIGLLGTGGLDAFEALLLAKHYIGVPNPASFSTTSAGYNTINLQWELNEYNHNVMIARAEYDGSIGQPEDGQSFNVGDDLPEGGKIIYVGDNTSFLDEIDGDEINFIYKIWALADEATDYFEGGDFSSGLTANGKVSISELPFIEDFDSNHNIIKHNWTFQDNYNRFQNWSLGTIANGLMETNGNYAYFDSNNYGKYGQQNSSLVSPAFDFSAYESITVSFKHYFQQYENNSSVAFKFSTDNGNTWNEVHAWDETTNNPDVFIKVLEEIGEESHVMFKFNYTGEWGFWWCVDDFVIMETIPEHYADFSADYNKVSTGVTVVFDNASTGGDFDYTTWQWNFGDDAEPIVASGQGPHEVIYSTAGPKTVILSINDDYSLSKPNFVQVFEITDKLYWDNNNNTAGVGASSTSVWQLATRFKTSDLEFYNDYLITELNVYVRDLSIHPKVMIWERNEDDFINVVSKIFSATANSWNIVPLDIPHRINASKELWIGIEYNDPGPNVSPAGRTSNTTHDRYANLLRFDIQSFEGWRPLSSYGISGNWNLSATIVDGNNKYFLSALTNPSNAGTLSGQGIYDQNEEVTISVDPNTNFLFLNWAEDETELSEDINYTFILDGDKSLVANFLNTTNIEDVQQSISIFPNPAKYNININAVDNIQQVVIYDIMGKLVYRESLDSSNHTINLTGFNSGLYLVQIYSENDIVLRKIKVNN